MAKRAEKFYNSISGLILVSTCVNSSISEWENYMEGTKKASYRKIHSIIRKCNPEWIELTINNPYKHNYKRKDGLIVVVHSAVEYFFQII